MLSIHPHVNPSFCTEEKCDLFAGAIKTTPRLKPFLVNFEYHNTNAPNVKYIYCSVRRLSSVNYSKVTYSVRPGIIFINIVYKLDEQD